MNILLFLLALVLLLQAVESLILHHRSIFIHSSTRLHLLPPESVLDVSSWGPAINDVSQQAAASFIYGFESRVIGTIFGNVLAGIAFKVTAEWLTNAWNKRQATIPPKSISSTEAFPSEVVARKPSAVPYIPLEAWLKLFLCVMIDAVSDSSFTLPGIGELEDIVWAPLSALLLKSIFASDTVAYVEFVKEILPFTDIIPLATGVWLLENVFVDSPLASLLKLKNSISNGDRPER
jgi:hypothetical protein